MTVHEAAMALREEFQATGDWLFRKRSYLPLVLLPIALIALSQFHWGQSLVLREAWELCCLVVSLVGLGIRVATVGCVPGNTSGRNTDCQIAAVLNTTGCYSVVRHPLYLGNLLIWLGFVVFLSVWWFVFLFLLAFWIYYERIMFAEEEFLRAKFGREFVDWAARTPAFLPRLSNWVRPALPFSIKTALKREYTGLFGIAIGFPVLDFVEDYMLEGRCCVEMGWTLLALFGAATYLLLRTLKKRTRVLQVEGR
jgi:protein-S-isoprenylcysteine O-methyltransferase Ste14